MRVMVNRWIISLLWTMGVLLAQGQQPASLTLQEAYTLAEQNYPLIRQKDLIRQTEDLTIKNLSTGFLPQATLNGQATYQSEVTYFDLPAAFQAFKPEPLSKDQYRLITDVSQLVYDGGVIRQQKTNEQLSAAVEQAKVEVELYQVKNRVVQLYFGILYQDELLKQTDLVMSDINSGISKVQPMVENGVLLRSNLQVLQAQLLQVQQRTIEIRHTRSGLVNALALFVNKPLSASLQLQRPVVLQMMDTAVSRPELRLYQQQTRLVDNQAKLIDAKNRVKTSLFFQGGYGRPGLNLLQNEFKPFYITGLRFTWPLGGYYSRRREKQLAEVSRQSIAVQQATFLLNTQAQLTQQKADIGRYTELVASDKAIVELRHKITQSAKAQLENAVINASDYLREVNAEDAARQLQATHQLLLTQAQINYLITSGKL